MLDSLTTVNARDFRARYQGTFGFYTTPSKKKLLVRIGEVDDKVHFTDKDGGEYYSHQNTGIPFEFLQVDRGWFNVDDNAVHLCRIPARQWQRGISAGNTSAMQVSSNGRMSKLSLDFPLLTKIYDTEQIPLDIATRSVMTGKRQAVALSKHFCLTKAGGLFLYNIRVADADFAKKTITVTEPVFKQEINDINQRCDMRMTIQ